jgi:hypothetical protein
MSHLGAVFGQSTTLSNLILLESSESERAIEQAESRRYERAKGRDNGMKYQRDLQAGDNVWRGERNCDVG